MAMTMCNVGCARANEPENPNETTAIVVTVGDRSFEATVDNSATGVQTISANQLSGAKFNLQGQRVSDDYRGIVIQKGQKRMQ